MSNCSIVKELIFKTKQNMSCEWWTFWALPIPMRKPLCCQNTVILFSLMFMKNLAGKKRLLCIVVFAFLGDQLQVSMTYEYVNFDAI